jgi:1-acyl-sn-glycerol-3-phosphate acyltransferase
MGINRNKGKAALKQIIRVSQNAASTGRNLLIFPQGTRLAVDAYQPYHSGLYAIYSATGLPVVPVALNSGYFWSRDSISKTPGHITVRLLPAIPAGLTRQELMAKVEDVIETESRKLAP